MHTASKTRLDMQKFDEGNYISWLIKDDKLLKTNKQIWDKISDSIQKEFESKSNYEEKYVKTKVKSYNGIIIPNLRTPKFGSCCICLSKVSIDYFLKKGQKLLFTGFFRIM